MMTTHRYTQSVTCPVCKRTIKGYVPRGGDGTALRPYRHTHDGALCPGRFSTIFLPEEQMELALDTAPETVL